MDISEFLKSERMKRCLTQSEMAAKLGVNRITYIRYEKGIVNNNKVSVPKISVRKRIAKFTGNSTKFIDSLVQNSRKEN